MRYEIRVLLLNEDNLVIKLDKLAEADILVPMLGNKFSEVKSIQVIATDDFGNDLHVLHQQSFTLNPSMN